MLPQHRLHGAPAGILIAVKEHADEQRLRLPAGNMKQRGSRQMPPELGGGDIEQRIGKMVEAVETEGLVGGSAGDQRPVCILAIATKAPHLCPSAGLAAIGQLGGHR